MTQPISVNDVLEVVLEGSNEQQPFAHVRHYLVTAVDDTEELIGAIQAFYVNNIVEHWADVATTLWVAECMSIGRVAPQPRNIDYSTFTPAVTGDIATDGLPPQDAVLMRLNTDEVGPRNRGRSYLCGVPEASTNGGVLTVAAANGWNVLGEDLVRQISSGGNTVVPVIFSRTAYNPAADPPQAVTAYTSPITSFTLQGNIATQRRRRTRRSSFYE